MRKLISLIFSLLIIISIDYTIPLVLPLTNKDYYFFGFEHFLNTARETVGRERIILVGGSSLGMGVSAEALTKDLELLTLNSGIHAGVGFRNFFRNIEDVLEKESDLIVISPEYNIVSQGGDLGRSNEFCFIAIYVRSKYPIDCVGYSIAALAKMMPISSRYKPASDSDAYIGSGFNRFGDYVFRVADVNLEGKMDNHDLCSGWKIDDLTEKYIPFVDGLAAKGYEIVYIPNFIPKLACSEVGKVMEFHRIMNEKYGILTSDTVQLFFDEKYFYDTAYHLTEVGVSVKTGIFQSHLRYYLDNR